MHGTTLAFLLAACALNVFAASNAELSVTGTITPSACLPALSQHGVIDYGKIPARDLNPNTFTPLPTTTLQAGVDCEASTLFALRLADNRAGSSASAPSGFGLGRNNGTEKLGVFHVVLHSPLADNAPITQLQSLNEGRSWVVVGKDVALPALRLAAFGDASSGVWAPLMIRDLTVEMAVKTFIAPAQDLTLDHEVPLDGYATLDLIYL